MAYFEILAGRCPRPHRKRSAGDGVPGLFVSMIACGPAGLAVPRIAPVAECREARMGIQARRVSMVERASACGRWRVVRS